MTEDGAPAPDDDLDDDFEELVPAAVLEEAADGLDDDEDVLVPAARTSVRKIVFRIVFVVGVLALAFWVLVKAFDDLDIDQIRDALGSLDDAEVLSLVAMWILWLASQGLLTASLIKGLPVRRGILAYLGPAAVTSLVPGPSDLPVRHRMLRTWGRSPSEATLAVTAGGLFSIGIKLLLPVVAAVGLLVSGASVEGALRTVVIVVACVGVGVGVFVFMLGTERRTHRLGRVLDPIWRFSMRRLHREVDGELSDRMVQARAEAVDTLQGRWLTASWATFLTATTRFALLLMCLRFMDMDASKLGWFEVFVVYALVNGLTVVSITAGDAGVSEVAYIGLLTATAGDQYVNQIAAAVLVYRLLTWLVIIPVGLGALGMWRVSLRRHPVKPTAPVTG